MRKRVLGILTILAHLLLLASPAFACICPRSTVEPEENPIAQARRQAQAVFAGKVIRIAKRKHRDDFSTYDEVVFAVNELWGGPDVSQVTVLTRTRGFLCGYPFKEGESYLVYVDNRVALGLDVRTCSRTRPLRDAAEDLKVLGKGIPPSRTTP